MLFSECVKFDMFTGFKKAENSFHAQSCRKMKMIESCTSSCESKKIFIQHGLNEQEEVNS